MWRKPAVISNIGKTVNMKQTLIFPFLLFASACFAQGQAMTISYTIDPVAVDSFFLVETIAIPDEGPRPYIKINQFLFRSTDQLDQYVTALDSEVIDFSNKAQQYQDASGLSKLRGDLLKQLKQKDPFWSGQVKNE